MKGHFVDASGEKVAFASSDDVAYLHCPDGTILVQDGALWRPTAVSCVGDKVWLSHGGETTLLRRVERRRRGAADDAGNTVTAPMTGRVVVVSVAVGDEVSKGDTVVVVEAMKMEQPLKAPRAGIVAAVSCEAGQLVDGGVVLVSLEKQAK